jgi:hypothetical protein
MLKITRFITNNKNFRSFFFEATKTKNGENRLRSRKKYRMAGSSNCQIHYFPVYLFTKSFSRLSRLFLVKIFDNFLTSICVYDFVVVSRDMKKGRK